jgi:hypothetical protein
MPSVKVAIDRSTYEFACAEFARINRLLDAAEVPTHVDGARYSVSQRVDILVRAKETLHAAVRKASGHAPH